MVVVDAGVDVALAMSVGVVTAASYFGTAAAFASCPYLMTQGDGSWEPVFYVFGGLGLLFLPAWLVLTREPLLPAVSDHIHEEAVVQQHELIDLYDHANKKGCFIFDIKKISDEIEKNHYTLYELFLIVNKYVQ